MAIHGSTPKISVSVDHVKANADVQRGILNQLIRDLEKAMSDPKAAAGPQGLLAAYRNHQVTNQLQAKIKDMPLENVYIETGNRYFLEIQKELTGVLQELDILVNYIQVRASSRKPASGISS